MLVLQQLQVLPAGAKFKIMDLHRCVLEGSISQFDKSLLFDTSKKAEEYEKVWSRFHVTLIDIIIEYNVNTDFNSDIQYKCETSVTWIINVR